MAAYNPWDERVDELRMSAPGTRVGDGGWQSAPGGLPGMARRSSPRCGPDLERRQVLGAALGLLLPGAAARAAGAHGGPPPPLDIWLREAGVPAAQVGVLVEPLAGGPPLLAWQSGQAFNPASAMKLLTSSAALAMLGPDYRWRTGAWLRGVRSGDVLVGDLILRGGGDPKLVIEDLSAFVQRMRAQGLRELRGDLVIDDSLFDAGASADEPFDGDASQPYNVGPHPLLMNFKASRLVLRPVGGEVRIALDPPLADVRIDNAVRVVAGGCRHAAGGLSIREGPGSAAGEVASLRVSGSFSAGCGEQGLFAAMLGHRDFIHALFKAAWEASGGVFAGRTRVQRGVAVGPPWLEWVSPRTLADVVRDINKFSNNVMSRNLLLQIGAERALRPAGEPRRPGLAVAREAVVGWLAGEGLRFPELVIDNGAGLSRAERIAPASLAALLRHVAARDWGGLLRESLPRVGQDGTMRHRLVGEAVAGRAWIKTGSLDEVRSIAGYVDTASGRRVVAVLLVNGPAAAASAVVQDRLLRWVHAQA
jgi:D-alanyl-D-alanine carboxypeptidase/D-alanyl-D-alanine-endopeptidase (penicillin-binding protein 4)